MTSSDWAMLLGVAALFAMSIVLAIAETAILRISPPRALSLRDDGRRGAERLVRILEESLQETVNGVLLLALSAQMVSAFLLGALLNSLVGPLAAALGIFLQITAFFVLAEAAPKTWVIQHTDRAALLSAPVLWFISHFPPLRLASRGLIGLSNLILPGKGIKEGPFVTEAEIRQMADLAAYEESIALEESELIHSIFEFGDTVVREVMQPRTDMVAVRGGATVAEAIELAIVHGYSRLPATGDGPDQVLGVAILKDLVRERDNGNGADPVSAHLREVRYVPESKRVAELLREMQTEKFHLAMVVDEYGGNAGLVTLEDLLEEIVGEITDEYDVEEPNVERLPDGRLRVPGRTPIDDLAEELGFDLPEYEWDTVGGLVFNTLGHVPGEGETLLVGRLELCTEHVVDQRIVSVLVRTRASDDAGDDGAGRGAAPGPDTPK